MNRKKINDVPYGAHGSMLIPVISPNELPKEALELISSRQKSYIDEFSFYHYSDKHIEAWYAGEHLATWNGKAWE